MPGYDSGRGSRIGRNGIPLSSASFNAVSSRSENECLKSSLNNELDESSNIQNKFTHKTSSKLLPKVSDSDSSLTTQTESSGGLLRRKRLERTAAHQNDGASTAAQSATVTARYGNQPLANGWSRTRFNSSNQGGFDMKCHQILHKAPGTSNDKLNIQRNETSNDSNTIDSSRLQTAVGVIFSGNDVSYV